MLKNKIDLQLIPKIVDCIINEQPFQTTTSLTSKPVGSLSSTHLRDSFVKKMLPFVEPVAYDFGFNRSGKRCTFVYVPILRSIQELLKRPDILHKVMHVEPGRQGVYSSFRDGSTYKENRDDEDDCLQLHITLYIDEWETVNPLGTKLN